MASKPVEQAGLVGLTYNYLSCALAAVKMQSIRKKNAYEHGKKSEMEMQAVEGRRKSTAVRSYFSRNCVLLASKKL